MQYRHAWIPAAAACLLSLVIAGCGADDARRAVRGTVTLDGAPLSEGVIRFRPAPGTVATTSGGPISGGRFELPGDRGLLPGEYLVQIEAFEAAAPAAPVDNNPMAGPAISRKIRIALREADPLTATVGAGARNEFRFALTRGASR